ncbi:LacI family DNA-binding transcriptional regulator [Flagellimonas myxillae]|uniref:LacI family DNA-binding transcriptional regulator n=1 Tax=Flagellimonas myxillae TaxID=2942214 RepID=UPI00201EEECA|nr:LacI family DNA-binding transcriptional regulator [Muricauda myxillae]MCL6266286.1 LacI family transcriptional regulator [Muricauda myxillae]
MQNNTITIHDIAAALKIDSSTVSRALNNSPRVTQKTKERIWAKAEEMGYQRNVLASNLRKSKTNTLGIIVPRISRYFFSSAIAGIEETAFEAGYNVIICQSLEKLEREKNLIQTLVANRVDGIIMSISMETMDYDHLEGAKKNGIPTVFFDRHCDIPGNNNVLLDDYKGSFDATQHLIAQGCKNIAHLGGPKSLLLYQNRFNGYKDALVQNGYPFRQELVFDSRLMEKDGAEAAQKILGTNTEIDGIFSANDVAAIGAMQYLKGRNVKIPEEIAVTGFSNGPTSAVIEPSLTTVDQSGEKMGKLATELLIKQINSKPKTLSPETIILEPSLIERESTRKKITNPTK